jgi:hypothetical protein
MPPKRKRNKKSSEAASAAAAANVCEEQQEDISALLQASVGDLFTRNATTIASTVLAALPSGATLKHEESQKLLQAFDIIKAELKQRTQLLGVYFCGGVGTSKPSFLSTTSLILSLLSLSLFLSYSQPFRGSLLPNSRLFAPV